MTEPSTEADTTVIHGPSASACDSCGGPCTYVAPPEPFMVGTYAIFKKPDGGVHLALREQDGDEHHIELPAFMVEMAASGEGISPMAMVKAMMSQRKRGRDALPPAAAGSS